jgi:hypothetical protein
MGNPRLVIERFDLDLARDLSTHAPKSSRTRQIGYKGGAVMTNEIPEEFQRYVVTDIPRPYEVEGHHAPAPFWIAPDMFPGVKMRVAGLDASKMVNVPHAAPHVHSNPEIYLAVSESRGEIVIEVQMDDAKFLIESPFAVFIPPGIKHCFKVVKCETSNHVLGILLPDWKAAD